MAATTTVLLSIAAASIAYAIARQTVLSTRATVTRVDSVNAQAAAEETLAVIESQLQANPTGFLTRVLTQERARVCAAGPSAGAAFQPGEAFPASCGTFWTYTTPTNRGTTSVELVPPSPNDPFLHVRVLSRAATLDDGLDAVYSFDGGRRWVWASTGALSLDEVGPSAAVRIEGGAYGAQGVGTPVDDGVSFADGSVVATDATSLTASAIPGVRWFGPVVNRDSLPVVADVRSLQRTTLSSGALTAAAALLGDVACPNTPAVNYTTADLGVGEDGVARSSHLCLAGGSTVARVGSTEETPDVVTIPPNVKAYMLVTDSPAVGQISVYATTSRIDLSSSSPLACSPRPGCAEDLMNAGTHPGQISYWTTDATRFLGTFHTPVTGVVFADADVYLGVCSSEENEYAAGEVCAVRSGVEPGMTISEPLTVVAGTPRSPRDVVVNSTIHTRGAGQLGVVATDRVVVPYWASGPGSQAVVAAQFLAVGARTPGSSVVTFPATLNESDRFEALVVNGSLVGRALGLGSQAADEVVYRQPADSRSVAPWFAGADATWRRREVLRFAGVDACQARKCDSWTADRTVDAGAGTPGGPSEAVNPDPPTGAVATAAWSSNAQALVSFNSPASTGTSPIDSYRVTCRSTNGGASRTATGASSPVTVTNLDPRKLYACIVEAHSAAGYSEPSSPTSAFTTLGAPDAPSSVLVTAIWNGTTNQATVQFSPPGNTGGLPITGYTTLCQSPDGGVSRQATGASPVVVTGLSKQQTYTCAVLAENIAGQSPYSTPSAPFATVGPPDAPTLDSATAIIGGATVDWSPTTTGGSPITGYELRWSTDGGDTWAAPISLPLTQPFSVTTLTPDTLYVFAVRASNAIGDSPWSTPSASVRVPTTPDAPTAPPTCVDGSTQTTLSWVTTVTDDGGMPVTSWVYRRSLSGQNTWTNPVTATSPHTVTGLQNASAYVFEVAAVNAVGRGAWSPTSQECIPYTVPSPPISPQAAAGNTVVDVAWSASSPNGRPVTSYVVTANPGGATFTTATTTCQVTGLTNGTSYTFTVVASNLAGPSLVSSPTAAVTPATTPSAPTITSIATGNAQLSVSFTAPASNGGAAVTSYQYSLNSGVSWTTFPGTTSPQLITGLSNGTSYGVNIRAVNRIGGGTASNRVFQTPYTTPSATGLSGSMGAGNRYASLSWSTPNNGGSAITGYTVQFSTNNVNWSTISSSHGSTSIGVSGLARTPVTYYFRVAANNAAGTGAWSTYVGATPYSHYIGYQEGFWIGWAIYSRNSAYSLWLQGDRNLVQYAPWGARWVRNGCTYGYYNDAYMGMQGDTNLVLYCLPQWHAGWASSFEGSYGYSFSAEDDGFMCLMSGWNGDGWRNRCW